jgi:hypothetical protein
MDQRFFFIFHGVAFWVSPWTAREVPTGNPCPGRSLVAVLQVFVFILV